MGERAEGDSTADVPKIVKDYVAWGAGPRASQFLILAAKAKALMSGHTHVLPAHLQAIALPVLRHRIVTNFNAEADGVTSEVIVQKLLEATPLDPAADRRPLDRLIT